MNKYKFLAYCSGGFDRNDAEIRTFEYPFEIFAETYEEAELKLCAKYKDTLGFSPENWTPIP
jgi:hypothetical protein